MRELASFSLHEGFLLIVDIADIVAKHNADAFQSVTANHLEIVTNVFSILASSADNIPTFAAPV